MDLEDNFIYEDDQRGKGQSAVRPEKLLEIQQLIDTVPNATQILEYFKWEEALSDSQRVLSETNSPVNEC